MPTRSYRRKLRTKAANIIKTPFNTYIVPSVINNYCGENELEKIQNYFYTITPGKWVIFCRGRSSWRSSRPYIYTTADSSCLLENSSVEFIFSFKMLSKKILDNRDDLLGSLQSSI